MMLRIGEFSRPGRVSVKALRHYEAVGLLRPAHVDGATGYRYYEPRQLDDLHRLMVLRALGLSLGRIGDLPQDDPSPELMRQLLAERHAALARKLAAEQAQLAATEARIRHIQSREPSYDVVVRDIPSAFIASPRRVVPDYGAVDSLFDEMARQPFEIDGPMRERYFSSAGDARFDLTEIQFPLRTAQGVPT